jgi:hypothetical protein
VQHFLTANQLRYEEQQLTDRAVAKLENRERLKSFARMCGLVVLAVAAGTIFASLAATEAMRL